jgi:hypothetical protein
MHALQCEAGESLHRLRIERERRSEEKSADHARSVAKSEGAATLGRAFACTGALRHGTRERQRIVDTTQITSAIARISTIAMVTPVLLLELEVTVSVMTRRST